MTIVWEENSLRDLEGIYEVIAQDNPGAASDIVRAKEKEMRGGTGREPTH